nr:hypothetical protein [Tanacetum cinerariifolium]
MATTIEQQVALDEAPVPSTQRLRIGRSNFRLPSDIQSKESTLQVVYDVLRRYPFFKAFLVTADVPEIYMQEFWATAYVHQHSIRFKLDNKNHIVNLETFRDMLYICPRILGQSFDELPFEEEILEFLRFLRHSAQIRTLTDVNINKLFQPWRSFGAVINKCLTKKKLTNDEIKNTKAYKEYYACATREASPKPKASTRRKRSGLNTSITPPTAITTPTTTIAVAPRLTAAAKGKQPAKAKSPSDPSEVARTEAQQLKIVLRRSRQQMHISQLGGSGTDEGTGSKPGVPDVPFDDSEEEISWNSSDDEDADAQEKDRDDDEGDEKDENDDGEEDDYNDKDGAEEKESAKLLKTFSFQVVIRRNDPPYTPLIVCLSFKGEPYLASDTKGKDEESFDPIPRTPESSEDEGNGEEDQGLRISEEERINKEEDAEELYRDVNINQGRGIQATLDVEASHVTLTPVHPDGQEKSSSVSSQFVTSMLNPPNRLKSLEAKFSEYIQTNPFAEAVSNIPVAADLSEMELKKILIENMKGNKSIQRSDEQRNLYKALVDAYEANKIILDSYGETDEGPFAESDRGLRDEEKVSASESAFAEEPVQTISQMDEPSYLVFEIGSTQTWISELAKQPDSRSSFNELLDTPLDFSNFIMNRLRADTLTLELLAGPIFELMKGLCTSLIELEYHLEEVYKATTDQLDWVNPEGQQYPHNLLQPLPLIPDNRGRRVIPFAHFIDNNLEYLRGGASSHKYTTSRRIISVTDLKIVKWHSYKHLDWITVRRDDEKLYKFKEGDFKSDVWKIFNWESKATRRGSTLLSQIRTGPI